MNKKFIRNNELILLIYLIVKIEFIRQIRYLLNLINI